MNKTIVYTGFVLLFFFQNLLAGNITAFVSYAAFSTPQGTPYIETYISFIGSSVVFTKNGNEKYQGEIEISMQFRQGDSIKNGVKYTLKSPEVNDTLNKINFVDLQRINLPNGNYIMDLTVMDKNKEAKSFQSQLPIVVNLPANKITISDIELIESYSKSNTPGILTKSGYDMIPYVSSFYPENMKKLLFYCESYNTMAILGDSDRFVFNYSITEAETHVKMSKFSSFKKQNTLPVNALMAEIPIEQLPSGNYRLTIELLDKNGKLWASKNSFFQRYNPKAPLSIEDVASVNINNSFVYKIKSKDSLKEFIRYLRPISNEAEKRYTETNLAFDKIDDMKRYFLSFWIKRNDSMPEKAWKTYYLEVQKVNNSFSTPSFKGYLTDRGRVYLQYGPPDHRTEAPMEPSAYPYEIWQYYSLKDQSNRRFVFYNTDMVTNDYKLLHSDARGEIRNDNWQLLLHKRNTPNTNYDIEKTQDYFGGRSLDNFNNPR